MPTIKRPTRLSGFLFTITELAYLPPIFGYAFDSYQPSFRTRREESDAEIRDQDLKKKKKIDPLPMFLLNHCLDGLVLP